MSTNTMNTFHSLSSPTDAFPLWRKYCLLSASLYFTFWKLIPLYYSGFQGHPISIPLLLKVSCYFVSSANFIITAHIFVPTSLMEISGWINIFWCLRWVCDRFFAFISNVETFIFISSFSLASALISFVRKLSWASDNSHFTLTLLNTFISNHFVLFPSSFWLFSITLLKRLFTQLWPTIPLLWDMNFRYYFLQTLYRCQAFPTCKSTTT